MIIRSPRPEAGWTIIDNLALRHPALSFKARGLLAYLLSLPDDWRISSEQLARQSPKDGRHSILTALNELEHVGYVQRRRRQDHAGRWNTETIVFDYPQTVDKFSTPEAGFPTSENRTPIEELTSNDLDGFISRETLIAEPILCGQCDGTGWQPIAGHLERCPCNGGTHRG